MHKIFNLVSFLFVIIIFACCEKDDPSNTIDANEIQNVIPPAAKIGHEITIKGNGFGSNREKLTVYFPATVQYKFDGQQVGVHAKSVSPTEIVVDVPASAMSGKIRVAINGENLEPSTHIESNFDFEVLPSWTNKKNIGGGPRNFGIGVSANGKGYVGLGFGDDIYKKDMWEYSPASNQWLAKAAYPGSGSVNMVAFSIGTKIYVGGGFDGQNTKKDFWEFDVLENKWTQKMDLPYPKLGTMVAAIENKGYIFSVGESLQYDPSKDEWIKKAGIPYPSEYTMFGGDAYTAFSIHDKGYIVIGFNKPDKGILNNKPFSNFLEYDPGIDSWTQKEKFFTGAIVGNGLGESASSFVIHDKAYLGLGFVSWTEDSFSEKIVRSGNLFEYNASTGSWRRVATLDGPPRSAAIGFAIGNKGYIGTGYGSANGKGTAVLMDDFWEYDPQ